MLCSYYFHIPQRYCGTRQIHDSEHEKLQDVGRKLTIYTSIEVYIYQARNQRHNYDKWYVEYYSMIGPTTCNNLTRDLMLKM